MTSRRHVQPGWAARSRCLLHGSRGGQCVGDGWARRAPGQRRESPGRTPGPRSINRGPAAPRLSAESPDPKSAESSVGTPGQG